MRIYRFFRKTCFTIAAAIFVSTLLVLSSAPSAADENKVWAESYAQWEKDSNKKGLTDAEQCQNMWDFFWPWAKRGNLQARAILYGFMTIAPIRERMAGLPSDSVSLFRDTLIFYVHSSGVQYEEAVDDDIVEMYTAQAGFHHKQLHFLHSIVKGRFITCIKKADSRESAISCAQIAVEDGLVPSFEDYAKELDTLTAQGLRPTCVESHPAKQSNPLIPK